MHADDELVDRLRSEINRLADEREARQATVARLAEQLDQALEDLAVLADVVSVLVLPEDREPCVQAAIERACSEMR